MLNKIIQLLLVLLCLNAPLYADGSKSLLLAMTKTNFDNPLATADKAKIQTKLRAMLDDPEWSIERHGVAIHTATGKTVYFWTITVKKADGSNVFSSTIIKADVDNWISSKLDWLSLNGRLFDDYGNDAVSLMIANGIPPREAPE